MKLALDIYHPNCTSKLPPIILHHGLLESKKTWAPLGQQLADRTKRKVYALDARNHGDNPWTNEYNSEVLVEDLNEFLHDQRISKTILIGHSMGGKVGMAYAIKYPEKVEKLVIEDVSVREFKHRLTNFLPMGMGVVREVLANLRKLKSEAEATRFLREMAHNFEDLLKVGAKCIESYDFAQVPVRWDEKADGFEMECNLEVVADAILNNKLQLSLSGQYEGRALFIYGEISQFKVDKDLLIENFFPHAIKIGIPEVGHFIHHACAEQFLMYVVDFINEKSEIKSKY